LAKVNGTIICVDLAGDTWLTEFVVRTPKPDEQSVLDAQPPKLVQRSSSPAA
jgi:hypothetical protein